MRRKRHFKDNWSGKGVAKLATGGAVDPTRLLAPQARGSLQAPSYIPRGISPSTVNPTDYEISRPQRRDASGRFTTKRPTPRGPDIFAAHQSAIENMFNPLGLEPETSSGIALRPEPSSSSEDGGESTQGGQGIQAQTSQAQTQTRDLPRIDSRELPQQRVSSIEQLTTPEEMIATGTTDNSNRGSVNPMDGTMENEQGESFLTTGLQFLPEIMNFATGAFGRDRTRPATRINRGALSNYPTTVNVQPQLDEVGRQYRAVLSNPSASMNERLAAMSMANQAVNQIHGQRINRENQLAANRAQIEAQLDSRQAMMNEQHRQEKSTMDANLGLTGNIARQALADFSQKRLLLDQQEAQRRQDQISLAATTAGLSDAARKRLLEAMENI